jgi:predicted dehydrogenase
MQGALIGYGTIGMGHLAAYEQMQNISITAIVDPVLERREQAANRYPKMRIFETIENMMDDADIEFIDICSPPNTHYNYIYKGLANQYHVLCEKPFLLSAKDYKGILSLINTTKRVLYPCHNYKFAPILRLIKEATKANCFGQIISGHFRTLRSGHALGVKEWNPNWRRELAVSGGGILRDHGPHSIYMAYDIVGQIPKSVSCLKGNLQKNGYQETEDTVLMTLNFNENLSFTINLSWAASFRNSYYAIFGTNENIIVENDDLFHSTKKNGVIRQSILSEFDDPSHKMWFTNMFMDFLNMVKSSENQWPLLQEALVTSLVIESAYESSKQGGIQIEIPQPSEEFM